MSQPSAGDALLILLNKYLPPTTSRIVLQSCASTPKTKSDLMTMPQAMKVAQELVTATRHFVKPDQREALAAALRAFGAAKPPLEPVTVQLKTEDDLSKARNVTKYLAGMLGVNSLGTQKAVTAVSEVARNIINYAGGGSVELIPERGPPARLRANALDHGKGIPNLPEILSGKYRSKTGMGLGILGVKRISDKFDIVTGPTGTRITFEILT